VKDEGGIVLGIDPGLGCTGWGVIRITRGRIQYLDSGRVRTYPKEGTGARLKKIFETLQGVARQFRVTACAVESGYVGQSPISSLALGQARAAAILAGETAGLTVTMLAPREVKLAVTGRGGAAKEQVAFLVGKMLGIEFDSGESDIADALAVALCLVLHHQRKSESATRR
jgi:crossover junction endodeoxyribonuclease RuvC